MKGRRATVSGLLMVVGLLSARVAFAQQDQKEPPAREARASRLLMFLDADALAFSAEATKALDPAFTGALAIAPPTAPVADARGLAFSGPEKREVAHFTAGLNLLMALGLRLAGSSKELAEVLDGLVTIVQSLGYDEDLVAKARALKKKGLGATPEDFQALLAAINVAIRNPNDSLAFGIGAAAGTFLLAASTNDASMLRQARALLKGLVEIAEANHFQNPMVDLARDLAKLAEAERTEASSVVKVFQKRFGELGLSLP